MREGVHFSVTAAATLLALTLTPAFGARAEEWSFVGSRYQAMGGAGVAIVNDEHAPYWNPGALAFEGSQGVGLRFSLSAETLGDVLADADAISNFINDNTLATVITKVETGTPLTLAEVRSLLDLTVNKLPTLGQDGEGFLALPDLGLSMRRGRMAITIEGTGSLAVQPVLDLNNLGFSDDLTAALQVTNVVGIGADHSLDFTNPLDSQSLSDAINAALVEWDQDQAEELVFQAELAGLNTSAPTIRSLLSSIAGDTGGLTAFDLSANGSGALIRGLATQEVGIAYGHPVFGDRLGIGANVRYLRGIATSKFIRFDDIKSGRDLINELTDLSNTETTNQVSVDLGLLLRLNDRLRFGVVGRNLTSPSFDVSAGSDYTLDPQVRVGLAMNVAPGWVMAADVDLTENETDALDGVKSRLASVGTELQLGLSEGHLALRAGAFSNLAGELRDSLTVTAGVGFRIWGLQLDLAAGASPYFQELNSGGRKIPSRLNVSGSIKWVSTF